MLLFAIFGHNGDPRLEGALSQTFPADYLKVGVGDWVVAARNKTAIEVSNALGITDGSNGSAIVVSIGSYYGRASSDIWEWMKVRQSQP
jgi:hypothetical protein